MIVSRPNVASEYRRPTVVMERTETKKAMSSHEFLHIVDNVIMGTFEGTIWAAGGTAVGLASSLFTSHSALASAAVGCLVGGTVGFCVGAFGSSC